jgi:hypothetical protein
MREPGRDPESPLEDEGIPDMQDGTPQQQWAGDPQEHPVPGDEPLAAEEYGTTAEEQHENEPLDGRLAREEAEPSPDGAADAESDSESDFAADPELEAEPERAAEAPRPIRIVEPDEGAAPDTEKEMIGDDPGPDAGGYSPEERAVRIEPEG